METQDSKEKLGTHRPSWWVRFYNLQARFKPPRILDLPEELLLCIATRLDHDKDLCRLSLVNRRFRHVAQHVLVRDVRLSQHRLFRLLQALCLRPELSHRILSVDLTNFFVARRLANGNVAVESMVYDIDKSSLFRNIRHMVAANGQGGEFDDMIRTLSEGPPHSLWTSRERYLLDVFCAVCPSLGEITIHVPNWATDEPDDSVPFTNLFPDQTAHILADKLHTLTVRQIQFVPSPPNRITVASLTRLTKLNMPLEALIGSGAAIGLDKVIPPNLRHLQLQPCNYRYIHPWLEAFRAVRLAQKFLRLQHLDLYLGACVRSTINLIEADPNSAIERLAGTVHALMQTGLILTTYNNASEVNQPFLEELQAWTNLSEFERWAAPNTDLQYSAAVARTESGAPRVRSQEEASHFVRGGKPVQKRRRTSRFEPQIDLKDIPSLTFGKDKKVTTKASDDLLTAGFWTEIPAECSFAMELAPIELDSLSDTRFSASQYDFAAFERSLHAITMSATIKTFNDRDWLGTEFFAAEPASATSIRKSRVDKAPPRITKRAAKSQVRTRVQKQRTI